MWKAEKEMMSMWLTIANHITCNEEGSLYRITEKKPGNFADHEP
jgi:hypothetical protein